LKAFIRADKGNIVFASPDGDVKFDGANKFSIKSDDGEYELNERLATIERESAEQLRQLQADLAAFKKATEKEEAEAFTAYKEKIDSQEEQLANMRKACPLGTVVIQVAEDGSLECTDYKVMQQITKSCGKGEVATAINGDGTPECVKVQAPIQACAAGSSIASVNADTGEVACEIDGADREFASFHTVWGRQSCPGNSELVYEGAMGGGQAYNAGGSATYICLPVEKPFAAGGMVSKDSAGASIQPIELRSVWDLNGMHGAKFGNGNGANGDTMEWDDVACAVCKTESPNQLMVTGHTTCPHGYEADHQGWLASGEAGQAKIQEHICLFNTPQGHVGQNRNNNQKGQLFLVELQRTALPLNGLANGYKYDYELPCVQCHSTSETAVSTYTRWGANSCPDKSKMLYDGFVTAGRYNERGGGANYQCIARGPEYTDKEGRGRTAGGRLYSVDYFTAHLPGKGTYNKMNYHDASCAVCEAPSTAVITVPGTQKCPDGYDAEYKGLIFSAKQSETHLGEYICVDDAPVGVVGQRTGYSGGGRMFPVEIRKAPIVNGYKDGREVGCAVCKAAPERAVTAYTTWGRRACPSGSKTVYSGWMANSFTNNKGGGYNYQCMAQAGDIEANQRSDGQTTATGLLTRVQYSKSKKNNEGSAMAKMVKKNNFDAACAVCEVEAKATLMLPAKAVCPAGYKKVYDGFLAGGDLYDQHDTEYICLEKDFEGLDSAVFKAANNGDDQTARLYLAEVDSSFFDLGYKLHTGLQCIMCVHGF